MPDSIIPVERIARAILVLRGQKVVLDHELAGLYGVSTMRLNERVKRNSQRFPEDFAFQLTQAEFANLISQSAISSWGGRRKPPWAFTEHGAIAAAFVLNSDAAVAVSVQVVRAFMRIRQLLASNHALAAKLGVIERRTNMHDADLRKLTAAFKRLTTAPIPAASRRRIGFNADDASAPVRPGDRARKR